MSFNIRNGRANDGANDWTLRRDLLYDIIRRHRPDVIGTQEGFDFQIDQMRAALPQYHAVGVGRDDGANEGEHCTIFFRPDRFQLLDHSTFWFSEYPDTPGSRHATTHHARICTWIQLADASGNAFTLYNVHLDHESQLARELSIQLLLERIQRRNPLNSVVVMGDFNMQDDNPALSTLLASSDPALQDSFRSTHPHDRHSATFHGFKGAAKGERIDYILPSREFQIIDARILQDNLQGRYPSDHYPITASLRLNA